MTIPAYPVGKPVVNVEYLVIAKMTEGETETYGTVQAIAPLMSAKVDMKSNTAKQYGDGKLRETAVDMDETTVDFEVTYLTTEMQALINGHKFNKTTGEILVSADDIPPYLAVGFSIVKSDGKSKAYWFYKGRLELVGVDAKQKEGKTDFSNVKLTGTFMDNKDGNRYIAVDESEGGKSAQAFLATAPPSFTEPTQS